MKTIEEQTIANGLLEKWSDFRILVKKAQSINMHVSFVKSPKATESDELDSLFLRITKTEQFSHDADATTYQKVSDQ